MIMSVSSCHIRLISVNVTARNGFRIRIGDTFAVSIRIGVQLV